MKSTTKIGLIGLVGLAVSANAALAGQKQVTFTEIDAWSQETSGGPFELEPLNFGPGIHGLGQNGAADGRFISFCLERNEYVSQGKTYNAAINTAAVGGGFGGGSPDPLDERTAFLYASFTTGVLGDLMDSAGMDNDFVYEQAASGEALQDAIWYLENEKSSIGAFAQELVDLADQEVAQGGSWYGKGLGSVRVLNLTKLDGGGAQDQLVMIPLPMPAALGLAGLLGVGATTWRRRRGERDGIV